MPIALFLSVGICTDDERKKTEQIRQGIFKDSQGVGTVIVLQTQKSWRNYC